MMTEVLVRDLESGIVANLQRRAASSGLGLEEEIKHILHEAAALPRMGEEELLELMARCRAMTPPGPRMSAEDLIREDRDSR